MLPDVCTPEYIRLSKFMVLKRNLSLVNICNWH